MRKNPNYYDRLVVVSYRLPFQWYRNKVIQSSGGLVSAILALASGLQPAKRFSQRTVWIGRTDDTPEEMGQLQKQLTDVELSPVYLEDKVDSKYYGGFCNDMIWPLFHYCPTLANFDPAYFEAYRQAQESFLRSVEQTLRPTDLVWVHDYHLMLLPGMIRDRFPDASIGFFLHIPFPSFEIFRLMPRSWREALLRGILGADLAGFHTFDYTQYFLRAARRTLGMETTMNSLSVEDRIVKAETFPLGIDFARFSRAVQDKQVQRERGKLARALSGKKLIFSVDRLDYSKGLLHRLLAFETFLEKYRKWRQKIVFNMVVVPSRESVARYRDMKSQIEAAVGRINGTYESLTWRPVVYQYRSLRFPEMVALYSLSDVGLITPIRDGMNLVAKEYVACQGGNPGVLILSEMAGAAAELSEAILINPTDTAELADAIAKALDMPLSERQTVFDRMRKRLQTYDVFAWAGDFFDTMDRVKQEQENLRIKMIDRSVENQIVAKYNQAARRIIFLDYDGTLVPFSRNPEAAVPGKPVLARLERLAADPKNTIVVISGRRQEFLDKWFDDLPIVLIAEHGAFVRTPPGDWISEVDADPAWKQQVLPILQRYVDRCTGAFIEEKSLSLVWHYRSAEPGIALLRSQELVDELRELVSHDARLQILEGHKVIEVKKAGYDKGATALRFLNETRYDFILAIGDDRTDEDLFRCLPPEAVTLKVGTSPSTARYNFRNQQEVIRLMGILAGDTS